MNIAFCRRRLTRCLALGLTFIVSGCAQVFPIAATSFAAQKGQKQPSATERPAQTSRTDDTGSTRPRRIQPLPESTRYYSSPDGPIIRVALLTDAESVSVTSAYGLTVRRATEGKDDEKMTGSGSLRVELGQPSKTSSPLESTRRYYAIRVATSREDRKLRKIADELRKKFFEPVRTEFDEHQNSYSVLIGRFANRDQASRLAERLRLAGYDDPRVVTDSQKVSGSSAYANARGEKYKSQPSSAPEIRSGARSENHLLKMIAVFGDKRTVSSEDELIVSALGRSPTKEQWNQGASARTGEGNGSARPVDRDELPGAGSRVIAPACLRVAGKDYRGEIHLVLNPRGRINLVNALPLEEYLRGVVPMELSPVQYPQIEALKAQAVAARSYALARLGQHPDEGYDLVDDTRAQVYGGLSAEHELSDLAVRDTNGVVAVYKNEDGNFVPIEALYTANCGGRTENNEEVFGGTPLPYLRGVSCAPDDRLTDRRAIVTRRRLDTPADIEGRTPARSVGLLSVLGFLLPRRITEDYLRSSPERDEVRGWAMQVARLSKKDARFTGGDATRLIDFLRLVAGALYDESRVKTLLAPADVDYLLQGLPVRDLPRDARADVAMLLRDGILQLSESPIDWRGYITRGKAIDLIARAISVGTRGSDLKSQISSSTPAVISLKSDTAAGVEQGRLLVAGAHSESGKTPSRASGSPFQSIEIADDAWLFRKLADVSYAVDRLTLIGGERVTYHLNSAGRIDFLEASISDRSAASDRFSSIAQWRERMTIEDIRQRLAASLKNIGKIDNIEPVAFSSSGRVTEVEVTGDRGRARLARAKIRAALGIRENLFVVDREIDHDGKVVAFIFTGRGWGHGVGMCQTGAFGLAKEGYSYKAILQKYYTGIDLQQSY